jgi:hypothetical protein
MSPSYKSFDAAIPTSNPLFVKQTGYSIFSMFPPFLISQSL